MVPQKCCTQSRSPLATDPHQSPRAIWTLEKLRVGPCSDKAPRRHIEELRCRFPTAAADSRYERLTRYLTLGVAVKLPCVPASLAAPDVQGCSTAISSAAPWITAWISPTRINRDQRPCCQTSETEPCKAVPRGPFRPSPLNCFSSKVQSFVPVSCSVKTSNRALDSGSKRWKRIPSSVVRCLVRT